MAVILLIERKNQQIGMNYETATVSFSIRKLGQQIAYRSQNCHWKLINSRWRMSTENVAKVL